MKKLFIMAVLGGVFSTSLMAVNIEALANKVLNKCETLDECQKAYLTDLVELEKLKEQNKNKSANKNKNRPAQKKRSAPKSSDYYSDGI